MNVAGPSRRVPPGGLASRERVESAYEQDLLALVNQLSLDEMDEIQTFFARRVGAGERLSDHDVAMNDLLQQAHALAEDRILAQRVAASEDVDAEPRRPVLQTPRTAVPQPNGRASGTGTQQNGNQPPVRATRNDTALSQTWGGWFSSMVDWAFGSQPASKPGSTNAGTTAPRPPVVNRPTGHDCVICQDPIHGAEIRAPCGHYYDTTCITDLFRSATRDETLYPPRCCRQNIPFAQVRPHLSQALITTFREKEREFSTLKRVYCSSPTCSRFLGPVSEGIFSNKVYTCPAPNCKRQTCGKCREQHPGDWTHACRPDADAAQVLELGRAAGWARCPGCSQMIELNIGCFHMTCRCRTEFCYLCHARWKTCACPQWDERRLLVAAEERVNAQLGMGRERAARRNVQPQWAHLAHAPAAPVRNPFMGPEHLPVAPRPPVPARRPAPAPPVIAPARPVPPARPVAPALPVTQASVQRSQSTSVHATTTASSLTGRPAHIASTPIWHTSASASASTRPTSTSTPAFASTSGSQPASASASASSGQPRRPKSTVNADPMRQRLVREMMERLRVDHECSHTQWRYRSGGGVCQSCSNHLPLYLFRCQGCEMLACNRCRRNRL